MLNTTLAFDQKARASAKGERPIFFFVLANAHGERVYSDLMPTEDMVPGPGRFLADGSYLADGSIVADGGSPGTLESQARILEAGALREGSAPNPGSLSLNLGAGEIGNLRLVLSNAREEAGAAGAAGIHPMSKIAAQENLLSASLEVRATFPGLAPRDALSLGKLVVESYRLTRDAVELEARAV